MSDKFVRQFSQSVKDTTTHIGKETLSFFGIAEPKEDEIDAWNQRRLKFALQKFGNINTQKLVIDTSELNIPLAPASFINEDHDEYEINDSTKQNAIRPVLFRGKSAPVFINRQISLRSNLVAPFDIDKIGSVGSCNYKKENALKTIGKMINIRRQKTQSPAINNVLQRNQNFNFSHSNINRIDPNTELFLEGFQSNKLNIRQRAMKHAIKNNLHNNFIFRLICCLMKHDKDSESICSQINDSVLYRPYFTYWITCVQILVFIVGCVVYQFAPIGLQITTEYRKEIRLSNGAMESVCWHEYDNLWIGPRQSDLIRLGARYSPCMRVDMNLYKHIFVPQIERERNSGCCIRNDGGGCYQSGLDFCSTTLSTWHSWKKENNSLRKSGPVCGIDPDFCLHPTSIDPFKWIDDITEWPICHQNIKINKTSVQGTSHISCDITGRPCCVGIKGECILTTPMHCTFMRGYFHSNAFLCSQVNCLSEICGMLYFTDPKVPDQYYRLLVSLFLHVGIVHLSISVLLQLFFLRDFEKMLGWLRTALIYILSGIFGNLASAIFLPYKVEAGPSGSCFAFLAIIVIEFLKSWKYIKSPWKIFLKYSLFTLFLFIIGLLPWVDNYAHIAGFISGILLSFVFLPFLGLPSESSFNAEQASINFGTWKKKSRRKTVIWRVSTLVICIFLWLLCLSLLIFGFKYQTLINCQWCKYLTCIPLGKSFCDNMDVNVSAQTPCLLQVL